MKNKIIYIAFIFLLIAQSGNTQNLATTGVRPLGMGGAFTAVANDVNALYWNPAGLPIFKQGQINFMHTNLYNTGIKNNNLGFSYPVTGKLALGFGWNNIGFDDNVLNYTQHILSPAMGLQIGSFLSFGASVTFLILNTGLSDGNESLFGDHGTATGYNVGALISSPIKTIPVLKDLQFGMAIHNFGIPDFRGMDIEYDSGARDKFFPARVRVGLAWQPLKTKLLGLSAVAPVLAVETDAKFEDRVHIGGELWIKSLAQTSHQILEEVALRAGVQKDWETDEGLTMSFGSSLRFFFLKSLKYLQFDYAYTIPPSLPATHRFGVSFIFPEILLFKKRVKFVELPKKTPNLFPALIRHYEQNTENGLFKIRLHNPRNEEVTGKFVLQTDETFYKKFEGDITIPAKDTLELAVTPGFNPSMIDSLKNKLITAQIKFKYEYNRGRKDSIAHDVRWFQYDKNTIIWDDFWKAAAFVSAKNSTLNKFARTLIAQSGIEDNNLLVAMWIFEALRAKGVRFMKDELTPAGTKYSEDTIQFPSDLLTSAAKAGDCDDLTVLYCSLLAQVGIETALIDAPKHIFMMFDTGIPSLNQLLLPIEPSYLIKRDGRLWIPIEITEIATNFIEAWKKGKNYYNLLSQVGGDVDVVNILDAWSVYPPLNFTPDTTISFSSQELRDIKIYVEEDSTNFEHIKADYVKYRESIDEIDDIQKLIERGIIYVGYGADSLSITRAQKAFHAVLDSFPNHPKALNNLGNIHFMQDSLDCARYYYERALSLSDTTIGIHWNLTQLYLKRTQKDGKDRLKYMQLFWDEISFLRNFIHTNEEALAFFDLPSDSMKILNLRGAGGDVNFIENQIARFPQQHIWQYPEVKPQSSEEIFIELIVKSGEKYNLVDLTEVSDGETKAVLGRASRKLSLELTKTDTVTVNLIRYTFKISNVSKEIMKNVNFKFQLPIGGEIHSSDPTPMVSRLTSRSTVIKAGKHLAVKNGYHLFWYN